MSSDKSLTITSRDQSIKYLKSNVNTEGSINRDEIISEESEVWYESECIENAKPDLKNISMSDVENQQQRSFAAIHKQNALPQSQFTRASSSGITPGMESMQNTSQQSNMFGFRTGT